MGRVFVLRQQPSLFASIADAFCAAEPQLTRQSGSEWSGLHQVANGWQVEVISRGVTQSHFSKAVIDTTGDATGARWLSPSLWTMAPAEKLYRPAYVCALPKVTGLHDEGWRLALAALIIKGIQSKALPEEAMGAVFRDSTYTEELFMTIDLEAGKGQWNPFDPTKRAELESTGRFTAISLWRYLREHHADFICCPPPHFPTQAGIRESARYVGDETLTGEDLAANRRFDHEIALAGWPMEKRENARGPKFRYFDQPQPAGIPAGCLKNRQYPGLFFAGRCLSADHEALASVRVMGTCMATGQAAAKIALAF